LLFSFDPFGFEPVHAQPMLPPNTNTAPTAIMTGCRTGACPSTTVLMSREAALRVARTSATDVDDIDDVRTFAPAAHGRCVARVRMSGGMPEGMIIGLS
jgi:hypothetical protein